MTSIERNIQRIQRLKLSCTLNDNGKERHFHHGHEYVEIGGIKWATMNIGANSVADNGLYFQWGDTKGYTASQVGKNKGKKYFGWEDYKYGNGTTNLDYSTGMAKYNDTDGLTILEPSDDAARVNWGGNWRMPSTEEWRILRAAVNTKWTSNYQSSGVAGLICTDRTDNAKKLFFPAVGYCVNGSVHYVGYYGCYWSNSLNKIDVFSARCLNFGSGGSSWSGYDNCRIGRIVRGMVG